MNRLNRVRQLLQELSLDAIMIHSQNNRKYFSEFTGSNGYMIITQSDSVLITDQRYGEQAKQETSGFKIYIHGIDPFHTIFDVIGSLQIYRIGYESKDITDFLINQLRGVDQTLVWIPIVDHLLQLRAYKDEEERSYIKKALHIAEHALDEICGWIKPGISELEIAVEMEYKMRKLGSEAPAFDTIVASGKHSALPHAKPTNRLVEENDIIVIDFGATWKGYRSDLTRTIMVGQPEQQLLTIHDLVLNALEATVEGIRPGAICHQLDKLARDVFVKVDMEQFSLRGVGHGVGLDIHEYPRVVMNNSLAVENGMVFTVEPGLYVPDVGGVRIEDMVNVTATGCEVLTRIPRVIKL